MIHFDHQPFQRSVADIEAVQQRVEEGGGSGYTIYIHRLTSVRFYRTAANLLCDLG